MKNIFLVVALTGLLLTQIAPLSGKALANLGEIAMMKCVFPTAGNDPSNECSYAKDMLLTASSLDSSSGEAPYMKLS